MNDSKASSIQTSVVACAHGFIGRHVAQHLFDQEWKVIGVGHGGWV